MTTPCRVIPLRAFLGIILAGFLGPAFHGQPVQETLNPVDIYDQLKTFKLDGSSAHVENFVLDRDRVRMTFTGSFYFAEAIEDGVFGAVFLGEGRLHNEPWGPQELESVKRFFDRGVVEATFTKAVFRFTDYTYNALAGFPAAGPIPPEAQQLATRLNDRLLRETGFNISGRLLAAIRNQDEPGVFYGEFDGGDRGRFSALLDHQAHALSGVFGVDGGEKGLLFKYQGLQYGYDLWTAFYDKRDIQNGAAFYSDAFDLVSIPFYRMEVDLTNPGDWLRLKTNFQVIATAKYVRVIPLRLNEGLPVDFNEKRNKKIRVLDARLDDGSPVGVIQEDWETGVSLVLPAPLRQGQRASITLRLEGKDSLWSYGNNFHYPRSLDTWYPRHGKSHSRFDIVFRHRKPTLIASVGRRIKEGPAEGAGNPEEWITEWEVNAPIAAATFVCGGFERHEQMAQIDGTTIPIDYYSPPSGVANVREEFYLGEMNATLRYFSEIFGRYPHESLAGAFFPSHFSEGFATLLLLQSGVGGLAGRDNTSIAHEQAHQWLGNIVGWRSYRDEWLSDGLAEHAGLMYSALRVAPKYTQAMIKEMRFNLKQIAPTDTGVARRKLYEVGPLILGHRLNSSRSRNADSLIDAKGSLVIRMLQYVLSNSETGSSAGFSEFMKDFIEKHRNGWATTESFMRIASEHFSRSSLGRKYGLTDLNWFASQWVDGTGLPRYRLDYKIQPRQTGGFLLKGEILQENVPESWFMLLPVVFEFSGNRKGQATIHAKGRKTLIEIALPERPQKVKLDPDLWILSEETSEKGS